MIDFHTHILPGIDDGSRDIQMTEQMLEKEAATGVTLVYATPPFLCAQDRSQRVFGKERCQLQESERTP